MVICVAWFSHTSCLIREKPLRCESVSRNNMMVVFPVALRNRAAQTETFPFWVKRWRAYLGVTQKRFAELWGVSPSMVQKIESNDYGVGQLSFDRLESLRTLLQMEPATFYGILSENDPDGAARATQEVVSIEKISAELVVSGSVSLPTAWLGAHPREALRALELSETTFATDRLRYALSPGALVVVRDISPQPLDIVVGTKTLWGGLQLLIFRYPEGSAPLFLRPFAPSDERVLELPQPIEIDLLGTCVGHWNSLR